MDLHKNMKWWIVLLLTILFFVSNWRPENVSASEDAKTKATKTEKTKNKAMFTNRLSKETSPYLLLHQHNPVDWYPWGPEAFEKAKQENKIIFLSV